MSLSGEKATSTEVGPLPTSAPWKLKHSPGQEASLPRQGLDWGGGASFLNPQRPLEVLANGFVNCDMALDLDVACSQNRKQTHTNLGTPAPLDSVPLILQALATLASLCS